MNWTLSPWWLPGAALAFFGLMIAIFPELLALIVASAFVFTGISWLMIGWSARRARVNERKAARVYYFDHR
jgi:hypothetical protein